MQISKAVTSGVSVSVTSLVAVVAAGTAIHLLYLAFNIAATSALQLGGSGQKGEGSACHCRMVMPAPGLKAWHLRQAAAAWVVAHVCRPASMACDHVLCTESAQFAAHKETLLQCATAAQPGACGLLPDSCCWV